MKRLRSGVIIATGVGLSFVFALFWVLGHPFVARASDLLVCPSGCTYSSIQAAVDAANNGDVVKVASGVYTDVHTRPRRDFETTGVVTQVVYISKSLTIRGGYTSAFTEPPNPQVNLTTLDAQGRGRVIYVTGPVAPVIEGLRIIGGAAAGLGGDVFEVPAGGGVYAIDATLALNNNYIFNNTANAGGGVYTFSSTVVISGNTVISNATLDDNNGGGAGLNLFDGAFVLRGNTIVSNTTRRHGGGLYMTSATSATLVANQILSNTARNSGGGVYVAGVTAAIHDNLIAGNLALNEPSAGDDGGGGLFGKSATLTLTVNDFLSNTAVAFGGGVRLSSVNNALLKGNTFLSNTAPLGSGGGVSLLFSNATLDGNTLIGNFGKQGGGVDATFGNATLTNNILADNTSEIGGGGVSVQFSFGSRLLHNTFARNRGGDGSGVMIAYSVVTMTNSIIVSHTVGITVLEEATATLAGTLWGSGAWANATNWGGAGAVVTGTVNVFGNPFFVNPATGDYHIGATSTARDAGVNSGVTMDIDGDPRPFGGYDIGADEYLPGNLEKVYLPLVMR